MLSKEEFTAIETDFDDSEEFIQIANALRRGMDFVCHHNAYLVAGFLRRRGHKSLHWASGYYQCREPEDRIRHSWIKLVRDRKTVAILEFDPRQLHERGGYENDLMPSGYIPEIAGMFPVIASIVDPDLVELPDEAKGSRWVVASRDVLLRFVENHGLVPQIDFAYLDEIGTKASEEFVRFRELWNESASE